MQKKDCLLIGKIVKSHGIHGEVIIETGSPDIFKEIEESIFIEIDDLLVPFFIETIKHVSSQRFRIKFLWINTSDKHSPLLQSNIYIIADNSNKIEKSTSPEILIDFKVIDSSLGEIGIVKDFIAHNTNPLLVIYNNNKEILIPYHPDIVIKIKTRTKTVFIKAPDGLLELYT